MIYTFCVGLQYLKKKKKKRVREEQKMGEDRSKESDSLPR